MASKINFGLIFYNDTPELLRHCLENLKATGFPIIAIDGAFKEFLAGDKSGALKPYSTDGSRELAEKYASIVIDGPADGWENQAEKRNQYLDKVAEGEFIFVIDADEIIYPFTLMADLSDDVYKVIEHRFETEDKFEPMSTLRVYRKYFDLRYLYQHCRLYRTRQHNPKNLESGLVAAAHHPENIKKRFLMDVYGNRVAFNHIKYARSPERRELKAAYYKTREEAKLGY